MRTSYNLLQEANGLSSIFVTLLLTDKVNFFLDAHQPAVMVNWKTALALAPIFISTLTSSLLHPYNASYAHVPSRRRTTCLHKEGVCQRS